MSAGCRFYRSYHGTSALLILIVLTCGLPKVDHKPDQLSVAGPAQTLGGLPTHPIQIKAIFYARVPITASHQIVVSIPDKKVYLIKSGKVLRQYSAMLGGANEPTPSGQFRIMDRIRLNDSVLGKAWMGFYDDPKTDIYYGIHGRGPQHDQTTAGCVALKNIDVVDLFRRVAKGDPVTIIGTRGPSGVFLIAPPTL